MSAGMTGTERKRLWRERNPEASRAAERERAQARRRGFWGESKLGQTPRPCASYGSYWRYENSPTRMWQRVYYPLAGAGAHRMTKAQRAAIIEANARAEAQALAYFDIEGMTIEQVFDRLIGEAVARVRAR
jgi:hypothetical protein